MRKPEAVGEGEKRGVRGTERENLRGGRKREEGDKGGLGEEMKQKEEVEWRREELGKSKEVGEDAKRKRGNGNWRWKTPAGVRGKEG